MKATRAAGGSAWLTVGGRVPAEVAYFIGIALGGWALSAVLPEFRVYEWTLWAVYGLLALSFAFVWGHAGIFSFGQAAFFGIGAYAYGVAGINFSTATGETLTALVVAALVAGGASALLGYFIFYGKVGDVYVAIITLAVTLVLLTAMSTTADPKYHIGTALLGGYNGMAGVPPVMFGSNVPLTTAEFFAFSIAVAAAVTLALRVLLRRPFGRVLAAVRENELRTQLLGYDVRRYKLLAFVIAGCVAGLAGGLFCAWSLFINPSVFSLQQAAMVAIWVLVGGRTSLLGAFVGVVIVQGLSSTLGGSGSTWTPIVLGAVLIAVVLLLPRGVLPSVADALSKLGRQRRSGPTANAVVQRAISAGADLEEMLAVRTGGVAPQAIRTDGLSKNFGGVHALNGVDIEVPAGTVHALIGPNGAGKSTCFSLLIGRYAPSRGRVYLGDVDITRLRSDSRARRGVGIKMQVASYYGDLSVRENLWLASYSAVGTIKGADEQTQRALRWLGMEQQADADARNLSHGEHQWLEIGMVVAGAPSVMLLDEPTAGMTRAETHRTVQMIRAVSAYATVVVVEHDMEFLRELDAPVTMFHQGVVFTRGSIEDLRKDERVLETYLGRGVSVDVEG